MKNILVISYCWPPMGGPGVQRIMKFCKYLQEFNYKPTVITSVFFPVMDESLLPQVKNIPVHRIDFLFNPVRWFSSNSKNKASSTPTQIAGIRSFFLNFIWLNFFIPDAKIGWYFSVKKKIKSILEKEHFDVLISTGPPFTAHLIGLYIKKKYKLPWLIDVRDPWVENAYYNVTYRFGFVKYINRIMEKRVLETSDAVITVGNELAKLTKTDKQITVIYNGYDKEDFRDFAKRKSNRFILGYYGSMNNQQIPHNFIKAISKLLFDDDFKKYFLFETFGPLSENARYVIDKYIPEANRLSHENINHPSLIYEYGREQVLLLLINNVNNNNLIITGKIFEYLYTGWPILGIGPASGEAGNILRETKNGRMFEHHDQENHAAWLSELFDNWKNGKLAIDSKIDERFSRNYQAKQLADYLDQIT